MHLNMGTWASIERVRETNEDVYRVRDQPKLIDQECQKLYGKEDSHTSPLMSLGGVFLWGK